MEKIKTLLSPLLTKYKSETLLFIGSALIFFISLLIYVNSSENSNNNIAFEDNQTNSISNTYAHQKIIVDLSGAVIKPDVYEIPAGSRLKDIISRGQGLSPEADYEFFSRNFNLARILKDQDKIHVPSKDEILKGIFKEQNRIVDQTQPQTTNLTSVNQSTNVSFSKININTANSSELDILPGIGEATAKKIIQNRPYQSVNDLITKKVLKTNIFNQVKDMITVN